MTRAFKVWYNNQWSLRNFRGRTFRQAAKKAYNKYYKHIKNKEITIRIKEFTQDSRRMEYKYVCNKQKLDNPRIITMGDREIRIEYRLIVKRLPKNSNPLNINSITERIKKLKL